MHRFVITCSVLGSDLSFESLVLVDRVIEFGKTVGDLLAGNKEFEPLCNLGVLI